jgi:hypothetical protein
VLDGVAAEGGGNEIDMGDGESWPAIRCVFFMLNL